MTRSRTFLVVGLLVTLLLAGVGSYYASSSPDGLEKVAGDTGFKDSEKAHSLDDAPFAGYGTKGVEDGRLSGGLAGVAGVAMTLLIGGGLFLVLRRKGSGDPTATPERDDHSVESTR